MKYVFFKLIPPRRTFLSDMSPAEGQLMGEHAAYWANVFTRGDLRAYSLGVVDDSQGVYGAGLLALDDSVDVEALIRADPTFASRTGFSYELYPVPQAIICS